MQNPIFGLLALSTTRALNDGSISFPDTKQSIEFHCKSFLADFLRFQDFLLDKKPHNTQLTAVADTQIGHLHEQATPHDKWDPIL